MNILKPISTGAKDIAGRVSRGVKNQVANIKAIPSTVKDIANTARSNALNNARGEAKGVSGGAVGGVVKKVSPLVPSAPAQFKSRLQGLKKEIDNI